MMIGFNSTKTIERLPAYLPILKAKWPPRRRPLRAIVLCFFWLIPGGLKGLDVGSLFAFGALNDFKAYFLAFLERFESFHIDGGKVREQIDAAIIGSNKTKTLRIIEPLNCTGCHVTISLL